MKTFYSLNEFLKSKVSSRRFALAIGVFDGVHKGHRRILSELAKEAGRKKIPSLLITFYPHPANVISLRSRAPLLVSLEHRLELLARMGVDNAIVIKFDRKLAKTSPIDFIKGVIGKLDIETIIVGKGFFFGKDRAGSSDLFRKFSKTFGYKFKEISPVKASGKVISSTRIRGLILSGKLKEAERLLSRPVVVLGTVIKGQKRGRLIGYPTANIDPHHEVIPPSGVYAVRVKFGGKKYTGILNIGIKPTLNRYDEKDAEPTVEVHIFDFTKSIYGKDLEIFFEKKIRDERRFSSFFALKKQIMKDEAHARRIFDVG